MKGSIFALTTAVVGAGLISLPLATYKSGILLTYFYLIFSAFLCIFSNMLLVK
jgi:amino acid permease